MFYSLVPKVKTTGETFIIYHTVAFPLEMCDGEKLQIQPMEGFIVNLSEYGWNNPTSLHLKVSTIVLVKIYIFSIFYFGKCHYIL